MDKKELVKIINEVVEYKLKKIVPQIEEKIRKELEESASTAPKEETYNLQDALDEAERQIGEELGKREEEANAPEVKFTKNEVLNKILNETMNTPKSIYGSTIVPEDDGDMETLNFNSGNMPSIPNMRLTPVKVPGQSQTDENSTARLKQQLAMESGDPNLAKIMAKDYRQMLKKADEKAKSLRPSGDK